MTGTIIIIYSDATSRVEYLLQHIDAEVYVIVRTCGIGNVNSKSVHTNCLYEWNGTDGLRPKASLGITLTSKCFYWFGWMGC